MPAAVMKVFGSLVERVNTKLPTVSSTRTEPKDLDLVLDRARRIHPRRRTRHGWLAEKQYDHSFDKSTPILTGSTVSPWP